MTAHAAERAVERFGVRVTWRDINRMARQIAHGAAPCVNVKPNGTPVYEVSHDGTRLFACVAPGTEHRPIILTFITRKQAMGKVGIKAKQRRRKRNLPGGRPN